MFVGSVGGRRLMRSGRGPWLRLLLLAACFLVGLFLGQVLSAHVSAETARELTEYLNGYFSLSTPPEPTGRTVLSALAVYFRYPLLAFLLGFASVGAALLPVVTGAYGFFLSFSVCCLTAAFGPGGVLLALAVFGLRCLITLPCYFAVAVPALEKSVALVALSLEKGGRPSPPVYDKAWWLRFAVVSAVLSAGVLTELLVTPWLLNWVLGMILR